MRLPGRLMPGMLRGLVVAGGLLAGVTASDCAGIGPACRAAGLDESALLQTRVDIEEADGTFHGVLDRYGAELAALTSHLRAATKVFTAQRQHAAAAGDGDSADRIEALLLEVRAAREALGVTLRAAEAYRSDPPAAGAAGLALVPSGEPGENPWPDIAGEPKTSGSGGVSSGGAAGDPNDLTDPWPAIEGADDTEVNPDSWTPPPASDEERAVAAYSKNVNKAANPWLILMLLTLFIIVLGSMVVIVSPMSVQESDADKKQKSIGKAEVRVRSRFVQVALPFWMPTAPDSCGAGFLLLFICSVLTAASLCFWVSMIAVTVGRSTMPFVVGQDTGTLGHGCLGSLVLRVLTFFGIALTPAMWFFRWKDVRSRLKQWMLLNVVIFLIMLKNAWGVASSFVMRIFMDAMVFSDADIFWKCYWVICGGMVFTAVVLVTRLYVQNVLGLLWREYLTHSFLDLYMARRSYYEIDHYRAGNEKIDNPDQRIQQDAGTVTEHLMLFAMELLDAFIALVSFATVLWNMKPSLTIVAICYSVVGSFVGLLIAWKLIVINYITQRNEANFRFSLVNVRNNPEAIAFYGGESREKKINTSRFDEVLTAVFRRVRWDAGAKGYMNFYASLATILPPMILFKSYFNGDLDFGSVSQAGTAFSNTMTSLSFVVTHMSVISELATAGNRLGSMMVLLRRPDEPSDIVLTNTSETQLRMSGLSASVPGGDHCIVRNLNFDGGPPGEPVRVLLVGASGVGKSSLLRVVAGLWRDGRGEVVRPPNADCLFLPQKPYMPLGDLRTQLTYPDEPDASKDAAGDDSEKLPRSVPAFKQLSDADLRQHLASVGLGGLPDRFDEGFEGVCDWTRVLSVGEQQRLATVRIFIRQPKLTILDEATSALSPPDEARLYQRLVDTNLSYLSVGHRDSLIKYHDKVIELQGGGEWRLYTGKEFAEVQAKKKV